MERDGTCVGRAVVRWRRGRAMGGRDRRGMGEGRSQSIMVQSGTVYVTILHPLFAEPLFLEQAWKQPPLALDGTTAQDVSMGLAKGMPFHPESAIFHELVDVSTVVQALTLPDRASSNIASAGHLRAVICSDHPDTVLWDEAWCELHSACNLKAASRDLCQQIGKFYSYSSLMHQGGYVGECLLRLDVALRHLLKRHEGIRPPRASQRKSKAILDKLFDLDAEYHVRTLKDGSTTKSHLYLDAMDLLEVDNGDITDTAVIDHYCWCPVTGRPCHDSYEDMVDDFSRCYGRIYFGRSYPRPAVTRFTNVRPNSKMLSLGFVHHNLQEWLIPGVSEKVLAKLTEQLLAPEFGSQASDFQLMTHVRANSMFKWVVVDTTTRWKVGWGEGIWGGGARY